MDYLDKSFLKKEYFLGMSFSFVPHEVTAIIGAVIVIKVANEPK